MNYKKNVNDKNKEIDDLWIIIDFNDKYIEKNYEKINSLEASLNDNCKTLNIIKSDLCTKMESVTLYEYLCYQTLESKKIINDFLKEKGLDVSITTFLTSKQFSAQRQELARRLKLAPWPNTSAPSPSR